MRYGIPNDLIQEFSPYVSHIDENELSFNSQLVDAPEQIKEIASWYE